MSNAQKGSNAKFSVASAAGSPKTITAITQANPAIVTATAHGFSQGDVVVLDNIVGMTQLNGRAFTVDFTAVGASPITNKFALKGVDTSGSNYSAYSSGGTATKQTMTQVAGILEVSGFDGSAAEIDVTQIDSTSKEYIIGLQDFGTATLRAFLAPTDAGQTLLRGLRAQAALAAYSVLLASGQQATFMAYVRQFTFSGVKADGAVEGQLVLRITKEPAYFA